MPGARPPYSLWNNHPPLSYRHVKGLGDSDLKQAGSYRKPKI